MNTVLGLCWLKKYPSKGQQARVESHKFILYMGKRISPQKIEQTSILLGLIFSHALIMISHTLTSNNLNQLLGWELCPYGLAGHARKLIPLTWYDDTKPDRASVVLLHPHC